MESFLRDPARGRRNLAALAAHLGPAFAALAPALALALPRTADPDLALNNLERLAAQPAARDILADPSALDPVLHLLATSQYFADVLCTDPDALPGVLAPPDRNPSTAELTQQLRHAADAAFDDAGILRAFRRFRHRQMLRVGANDVLRDRPLDEITRDLARVADASIEVALQVALRTATKKFGTPATASGTPARLTALAFGKLGGDELNYSSDIDLMFVYDEDGETTGRRSGSVPNAEFFARAITDVVRILSSATDRGFAYRVDLRLRPEGSRGPLARSLAGTLSYYDVMGRTWERQALIKLRHVAGDADLGREFVRRIEPFVYRKYFSFSEINEVKALKRKMEQRANRGGADDRDVKAGRGGIRDIEYTVQFLQLLNGGDLPAVRQRNTLLALDALEIAGCLTPQETYLLAAGYRFLRKTEHRLQLLFDMQTHTLPAGADELRTLARRMGYREGIRNAEFGMRHETKTIPTPPATGSGSSIPHSEFRIPNSPLAPQKRSPLDEAPAPPALDTRDLLIDPLDRFLKDLHDTTRLHRTILDHLLHQTFADAGDRAEPEADLILDPDPDDATVAAVFGRYGFRDPAKAYQNLAQLAREAVPFLSHRRCRHFLASIAPQLLAAVADTPDPDAALNNLERVTASLGAKAVLYELFSFNPATLKLYVDLCAGSPFLSGLLVNNPGMIDELLDSLVLDRPRPAAEVAAELTELCRGASDLDPILHSFQDKELLRVGVRDLFGKVAVRDTTAELSDLADAILNAVFDLKEPAVRARYGEPAIPTADFSGPLSPASGERVGVRGHLPPANGDIPADERRPPHPHPLPRSGGEGERVPAPCRYAVVGLGKLGGREISYHSDLDLLVVFEADGSTTGGDADPTTNFHYFTELAQKVIQATTRPGPMGRLYAVDMRLRPTGRSGSLVLPLAEFRRYFAGGGGQLWERMALTRARVVRGEVGFAAEVMAAVREAVAGAAWCPAVVDDIRAMRGRMEATAPPRSLKRGPGGLVDIEFAVQMLQLKYGRDTPAILEPNVWAALAVAAAAGVLPSTEAAELAAAYTFLRGVEARLRVVTDRPLTELPDAAADRAKLARRLGFADAAAFDAAFDRTTAAVRGMFLAVCDRERAC